MSLLQYRSAEPLYIVIIRDDRANSQLKEWCQQQNIQAAIEGFRMKLFDQRSLWVLQTTWPHSWNSVTIWDCWNRRHIYPE